MWGGIEVYCSNCGVLIKGENASAAMVHPPTSTVLCCHECLEEMEWRYTAKILNKPTERASVQSAIESFKTKKEEVVLDGH